MKKTISLAAIAVSVFMLVSASVWEGTAAVGENLPENGFYLATNSFPVNTIVEVVNLENNRSAILIVSSSLENSGLLALLSIDAAEYIGLNNMGRIRMRERDDQVTYSGLGERMFFSGDPNYSTDGNAGSERTDAGEYIVGEYFTNPDGYDLAMIPAENRPPEDWKEPDSDYFIPPVPAAPAIPANTIPPEIYIPPAINVIPPVPERAAAPPAQAGSTTVRFSAPVIQSFERGMYYVQIGAYRTAQTVESEIIKVDKNLPVAVMRIESEDGPIYRVLIGPLNLGEGGAVLQRYRAIYKDAIIRVGV
jgi:hypothetical protein